MEIKVLTGTDIAPFINDLAQLRIEVFREWPYIYEGDLSYEKKYLKGYTKEGCVVGLALDNEKVVGATTGMPVQQALKEFASPFKDREWDLSKIYYFGESVLLPRYRGKGLGNKFFDLREDFAINYMPNLEYTCFCAVIRPDDHPLKPSNYRPLKDFWNKRGYFERPDIIAHAEWPDVGDQNMTEKSLSFWFKQWK